MENADYEVISDFCEHHRLNNNKFIITKPMVSTINFMAIFNRPCDTFNLTL